MQFPAVMEKSSRHLTPAQDALQHIVGCRDKPFLEQRFIDTFKGRGVFTQKTIKASTFVVEYRGNIFARGPQAGSRRADTLDGFLFHFSWNGAEWCVDASKEDWTLGRLVNDDHMSPNCEMKKIVCEGKPHLCLFAIKEISPGEEITYNYGDSRYSWRSEESIFGLSPSNADFNPSSSTPRTRRAKAMITSYCEDSSCDDEPGPSRHTFQDSSQVFSSEEEPETSVQQQEDEEEDEDEDEDEESPDEQDSDEQHKASEGEPKAKDTSFTSRNYCYVCGKGVAKVARHFLKHIDEEPDIAEAFSLPKSSAQRKMVLDKLRNKGNYQHNQEVLKSNSGELKVRRRPTTGDKKAERYVHCLYCKAMYKHVEMWRHLSKCAKKTSESATSGWTGSLEFSDQIPPAVKTMLTAMRQDKVALVVQNDFLLIQLAKSLSEKYGNDPSELVYIRQKLRDMGRLLLELHKKTIINFEDAIQPKNFKKVANCVKNLAGFDYISHSYVRPNLAVRLGNSLKTLGSIALSGAQNRKRIESADASTFVELCEREWAGLGPEAPLAALRRPKVSSPSTIPFTRDVQAFYGYLERSWASAAESLKTCDSPEVYGALCGVTLAQASVLSKCSPEISKMTLKSFQERDDSIQVLSKHFIRINIQSRSGRSVAVLLTSQLVGALTLLSGKRRACGVHEDNPFLFAKPDSSAASHLHGGACIQSYSTLCHAENPEHLTSAHLHKHVARIFQILHLENDELHHLANLLGHDIRADRDYYRLPEAAVELAKIAKLLLAMEKGSLERFKGNSLEEVEIEDKLEPDVEQNSPGDADAEEDNEESDLLPPQSGDVDQQDRLLTPVQDALEHIKARRDKPFLQEKFIDSFKGRGVFTTESIEPSSFVVEYRGDIFPREDTQRRRAALNDYRFDFSLSGTNWRVDASADDGSLGRLVNDDHVNPNCKLMKVVYDGKPHLCLFAWKKISAGQEITYNYGSAVYPWRSKFEESSSGDEYVSGEESEQPDGSSSWQEDRGGSSSDDSGAAAQVPSCTKRNYCYVCGKPQTKISRHLFTHRNEEPDIAAVFKLRRKSKDRKKALEKLRTRGNHTHNQEVLKARKGRLKSRRKVEKPTLKTSAVCIYCKNMFGRQRFWQHIQRCPSKPADTPLVYKTQILSLVAMGFINAQHVSSGVRKMLKKLKKDDIGSVVLKDSYLLLLAQYLHCSQGSDSNQKLRLMGRVLLKLQEKSIFSFEEALKPQNFSSVVETVGTLAGAHKEEKAVKRLKVKMGNSLKKIADIKYARALNEAADEETVQEAKAFINLCAKEWPSNASPAPKAPRQPTIGFIRDVQLLHRYIERTVASAVGTLSKFQSPPVYSALLRGIVAYLSILNGNVDVSKMTVQSFQERDETGPQEAAAATAGRLQFEQILSKRTVKISVVCKSGKKVGAILPPDLFAAVTLLVEKREACGVPGDNPYIFAKLLPSRSGTWSEHCCVRNFVKLCGASGQEGLQSAYFRYHMMRIFQILILSNEELGQLAELLGRDIRTEREFYQTPEAASDVAKILELLSAMETDSLEIFQGKTLEEINFPAMLDPVMEQKADDSEGEGSQQADGASSSKGFMSAKKKGKGSSSRRSKKRSREEDNEQPEETNDAANTPEEAPSCSKENESQIYFSDYDDDMNVDFNMDVDTDDDDVRNEDNEESGNLEEVTGDHETEKDATSPIERRPEETAEREDSDRDEEEEAEQNDWMDVERTASSSSPRTEKIKLSAALRGMKEVKIMIPKLNIEKMQALLLSLRDKPLVKDQLAHAEADRREAAAAASTEATNKPSRAQAVQMSCSHCKKSMMKGHTAYQKKGFTDVFCSKTCLFEMFPPSKAATRMCFYCLKEISQPLDLIMAVVDLKGTMKDFCSPACLCSFKSNSRPIQTQKQSSTQTPPLCRECNRTCTTTLELTLDEAVHSFCSQDCMDGFCRDNVGVCENCSSVCCKQPFMLKLDGGSKTICGTECLEEFKENIGTPHQCTQCRSSQPVSDMVSFRSSENTVRLFCNRFCVASYKLLQSCLQYPQVTLEKKRSFQSDQRRKSDDGNVRSAAVKEQDASPAAELNDTPVLVISDSDVKCCSCSKDLPEGRKLYQLTSSKEVFCSEACVSERNPNKKCHNCFQSITRPQNIILAPVDDSGTKRELCSNACLSSVESKRKMAAAKLLTTCAKCVPNAASASLK
ncbi:uncharacterized protein [Leuresthes tenuis]|uniref:uncharacterized protein n=1 Tax=Leuresthes tenuis TaxID=355514 RepID=UPI003B513346